LAQLLQAPEFWFTRLHGRKNSPGSVDHAGLEVKDNCAGQVIAARSLVVKHADAAELRVVAAAVLAVAADALLVAHHLQKLSAHLFTEPAHLHVRNSERRSSLETGNTLEKWGWD
jgi:hypothetical protein